MTHDLDQLRRTLDEHAADVELVGPSPTQRAHAVTRRAARSRRRRVGVAAAAGLAGTAAVAAVVVVGPGRDIGPAPVAPPSTADASPSPTVDPPHDQMVAGVRYPGTLEVDGSTYWLGSWYEPDPGQRRAVVEVSFTDIPVMVSWSTTPGTRGSVTVRVDGTVVRRSTAGALESELRLRPGLDHRVVVTAPLLRRDQQIGVGVYTPSAE